MRRLLPPVLVLAGLVSVRAEDAVRARFEQDVRPLLEEHCYDCHGEGASKGGVTLDQFDDDGALRDHKLWLRVLKNTRSHIMPPADEGELTEPQIARLGEWIKRDAFGLDPARPDPGRVTVRRLNRVEYRNTVRDLFGVDFDTQLEFPADDTGHGFDNIGDVLTLSPMLLEKYLDAAQVIVNRAVPMRSRVVAEHRLEGRRFLPVAAVAPAPAGVAADPKRPAPTVAGDALDLSYYTPVTVESRYQVTRPGAYQLRLELNAVERYVDDQFDYNKCRLRVAIDGEQVLDREFVREGENKLFQFTFDRTWSQGEHRVTLAVEPLDPALEQKRALRLRVKQVVVRGPLDEKQWVQPPDYARFFPRPVPRRAAARAAYARELLTDFLGRAYRRPVDRETLDRMVRLSTSVAAQPGGTFESGIAQAMIAALASPRFLFREEEALPGRPDEPYRLVDEFALASRLSYFLWSTMPDAELFRLAREGKLRANLPAQIARLLADPKSGELVRNFAGQWLQARDITNVQVNALAVHLREYPDPAVEKAIVAFRKINVIPEDKRTPEQKAAFQEARRVFIGQFKIQRPQLTGTLRDAMQRETEMTFAYVLREGRDLVELLDSNYTFLNDELARHYGIQGVTGAEMRRVELPPGSPRGGVLTQGTVLAVTSNPTRTSPVKRGVFILNSILGTPPAPPPPNIPPLEEGEGGEAQARRSLRDTLALHAANAACRSCHNRMDPLGLALENFNAMGQWRDTDMGLPVQSDGRLITGEEFKNVRELKHILATRHRRDFFTCVTEKLLTYALGRGLDYTDVDTVDRLVADLDAGGGRLPELIRGIVESPAFQQRRVEPARQTAAEPGIAPTRG